MYKRTEHTSPTFRPSAEVLITVLPFDVCVLVLERLVHAHVRPVDQDMSVKISPCHLSDPSANAFNAAVELLRTVYIACHAYAGARGQRASRMVDTDTGSGVLGGEVARCGVMADLFSQEECNPIDGCGFTCRPHTGEALFLLRVEGLTFWRRRDIVVVQGLELLFKGRRILLWHGTFV